jgi:protein TonB
LSVAAASFVGSGTVAGEQRHRLEAIGIAIMLECAILGGGFALFALMPGPAKSDPAPVTLDLAQPPEEKQPEPPKPRLRPPEPRKPLPPEPGPVPPVPQPAPQPPEPPPSQPAVKPVPDLQPAPEPTPFSEPVAPPAPPPPPVPAPPTLARPDPMLLYAAQVKAAVQSAVVYPAQAQRQRLVGRTRVQFTLRDGKPSEASVLQSSGLGVLDQAALASVAAARYPAPSDDLAGVARQFQVWVEFRR